MTGEQARDRGRTAFREAFGDEPDGVYVAPGRVNLIGEHTDYQQGLCLPMAIDRQTVVAARRRADRRVTAFSRTTDQRVEADLDRLSPAPRGAWFNYVAGVIDALGPRAGLDLAIDGDLPVGAGLSSSASLEMAVAWAVDDLGSLGRSKQDLARCGQRAENAFAGVQTGIMDQFASALGREGMALLLDVRQGTVDLVPFNPEAADYTLLVIDTKAKRQLVGGGYQQRVEEAAAAAAALGVSSLREALPRQLEQADLPPVLRRRARHIVGENERVRSVAAAAAAGHWAEVGQAFYDSHRSLRDDYEVSHPALDLVVSTAQVCPGVVGARLTGAGFGGAAIVLCAIDAVSAFVERLGSAYRAQGYGPFQAWRVRPAEGAHKLEGE